MNSDSESFITSTMENKLKPIAIWLTDPHLSPSTIEANLSIYHQVFDLAEKENIKVIYLGGDIFESRKAQPQEVLNIFSNVLREANERKLIIRAIPGNHDKTNYTEESSFLDVYEPYGRFELIKGAEFYDYEYLRIHLVPYFDERLTYPKYLEQAIFNIDSNKTNILLTHIGIEGVLNNNKDVVNTEMSSISFEKFDSVLIGHFHDQQQVTSSIYYTGSCYQANFGEDENKGCCFIYEDGSHSFTSLDFDKYHTLRLNSEELDLEKVNEIIEEKEVFKCHYKVQLVGAKSNLDEQSILTLRSVGIKVENKQEEEVIDGDESSFDGQFGVGQIKDSFEEWCQKRNPTNIQYGREKINSIL